MLDDLFGEGAGEGRYPEEVPVRGDGGEVRGVSEEVREWVVWEW